MKPSVSNMKTVELYNAYGWYCEECGEENIAPQMHMEVYNPATDGHGNVVEDGPVAHIVFVSCPRKILKCRFCNVEFTCPQAQPIINED